MNGTNHQPNAAELGFKPVAVCLLLALALGAVLPAMLRGSTARALLLCLVVCGGLGGVLWLLARLPVVPVLLAVLIASTMTRTEFNLFKIDQEMDPSGLRITLTLVCTVLLAGHHLGLRLLAGESCAPVFPRSFSLLLAALFGWCCFSVAYSRHWELGGVALWLLAANMLTCFVTAAYCRDCASLRAAVLVGALAVALSGVLSLLQYGFDFGAGWTALGAPLDEDRLTFAEGEVRRISGLLRTPTGFAWNLGAWLPVFLALLATRGSGLSRWQRGLCLCAAGLGLVALILTYARGSWAACGLGLLLLAPALYFVLPAAERRAYLRKALGAALLLGLLCLPFAASLVTRLTEDDRGSASSRLPSMEVAAAVISDNPLWGIGLNTYRSEARRYDETARLVTDELVAVHNMYMHMAAEGGLPSLLFFLLALAVVVRRGWLTLRRSDDLFLRTLTLGLLHGLFVFLWTGLKEPGSFGATQLRLCFLFCGLLLAAEQLCGWDRFVTCPTSEQGNRGTGYEPVPPTRLLS